MNDPDLNSSMEQYCTPYYDKHGLYNDGFPCPPDKYCCQNKDGIKYCCLPSNNNNNNNNNSVNNKDSLLIYTTNKNKNDDLMQQQLQQQSSLLIQKQSQLNNVKSVSSTIQPSLPLMFTNSTLLISVCIVLAILIIIALIIYFCICRRLINKNRNKKHLKNRIINSTDSSTTTTSSSLTTPIELNIESNNGLLDECHHHHHHHHQQQQQQQYIHSHTHFLHHPHISLHHKSSLTIDANQNHHNSSHYNSQQNQQLASLNQNNYINGGSSVAPAAISSGSSNMTSTNILLNMNSISSANTTQTSLATASNHHNLNENIVDFNQFINENDENDDDVNEQDFILYTSNNLDYLKSHSLFNKAPLNYYPSLKMTASLKTPFDNPPAYTDGCNSMLNPMSNQASTNQPPAANVPDLRFSTFLPPMFAKNELL